MTDKMANSSEHPEADTLIHRRHPDPVNSDEAISSQSNGSVVTSRCKHSNVCIQEVSRQLRSEVLMGINNHLGECLDGIIENAVRALNSAEPLSMHQWEHNETRDKQKTSDSSSELPEKVFCSRNSILTDLMRVSHIRSVYHAFVAILLVFALNAMLTDLVEKGGIVHTYHLDLFLWAFDRIHDVFICWLCMFAFTTLFVYLAFIFWASRRPAIASTMTPFDVAFLALYVVYQVLFGVLPVVFVFGRDLPPASTMIVVAEQIRMMMKSHAFIRGNAQTALLPRLSNRPDLEPRSNALAYCEEELRMSNGYGLPHFSHYLYFLFAPTLIYRDVYPRTQQVRWRVVASYLFQVCLCVLYNYYIFARFCFAHFADVGRSHRFTWSLGQIVISSFGVMLPSALLLIITFYAFLHCWMNAFAEMLRFGDRLFYKDWWNSINFSAYYRGWNVVVHDWLYTYVYRDIQLLSRGRCRGIAQIAVFMLSAFVHEYVLTVVFRFFYPVLFVTFGGAGFAIANIRGRSRLWNIGIWAALIVGTGILFTQYSLEWYARKNCPSHYSPVVDIFLPRIWFCKQ